MDDKEMILTGKHIDFHHHFVPPALFDYARAHGDRVDFQVLSQNGDLYFAYPNGSRIPIYPGQYDNEVRLRDLKTMRLDGAVLSVSPMCFLYWLDAQTALDVSVLCNDFAAQSAAQYPGVLFPMATLPMQDMTLAIQELRRAHEVLHINAVEVAPVIEGFLPDDLRYEEFYRYCAENGVTIFLHPQVREVRKEYERYYNTNLVGNVYETNLALNHMMFGGVFERHPKLKVLAAHGGGYFPYQLGRLQHGYEVRQEPKASIDRGPMAFLDNLYFDTITHWKPALQFLADSFGAERVVIGTDYPFDMGDLDPMTNVDALRLTREQREMICNKTAASLLKLRCE